nr:hypothetical protein [Tanacetum cinerariifolium]
MRFMLTSNDDDSNDDEEEKQDDEYIHTLEHYVPTKEETNDDTDDVTKEKYERINEELYGDVNDAKELKTIDHTATLLSTIKYEVPNAVKEYLVTSLDDALYKPKSTFKFAQAEGTMFEAGDTQEPYNQGQDMGDDEPNVKSAPKHDWFKKPKRPPTPDSDWNVRKLIDFRPPQA